MLLIAVAIRIEAACSRQLKAAVMVGIPEFGRGQTGELLQDGIYSRTRNPRYLSILTLTLGFALIAHSKWVYTAWLLFLPGVYLLILMEERELRERFGSAYRAYMNDVPRLVPRTRP